MNFKIAHYFILFFLLISCSPRREINVNEYEIPELIEYYDSIVQEAKQWSSDAYLWNVAIPFGKRPWLLEADFLSRTKNNEQMVVSIDLQGKLTHDIYKHDSEVLQMEPILRSNWRIGSQEAFRILVSENIEAIGRINNLCGSLMLNRASPLRGRPLVWKIIPYECGMPSGESFFLNPVSGTVLVP